MEILPRAMETRYIWWRLTDGAFYRKNGKTGIFFVSASDIPQVHTEIKHTYLCTFKTTDAKNDIDSATQKWSVCEAQ